jgi:hypothetical protein
MALTPSVPTFRLETLKEAVPCARFALPNTILPFINATVPVGRLPPEAVTVAVRRTGRPEIEVVALVESAVTVGVWAIVSVII